MPSCLDLKPAASDSVMLLKHPQYYMPDGNVVVQVQNTLFKLDLLVLHEKSPIFRMIVPPEYAGKTRFQGFDDVHPFMLHEITELDFIRLLWILYPDDSHAYQTITVDEWLSILKLATKYQIEDVRDLAAARIHSSPIDPIRKIAIWEEYRLDPSLLVSSYVTLCRRVEPLTLAMTMSIGLKNFTQLAAWRDAYHYRVWCSGRKTAKERQVIAEEIVAQALLKSKKPMKK